MRDWRCSSIFRTNPSAKLEVEKATRSGSLDIAIIQSTHGKEGVKDFVAEYGQVIADECHHLSAFTFEQVMKASKSEVRPWSDGNS